MGKRFGWELVGLSGSQGHRCVEHMVVFFFFSVTLPCESTRPQRQTFPKAVLETVKPWFDEMEEVRGDLMRKGFFPYFWPQRARGVE